MSRDRRLLTALILLIVAAIASAVQAAIVQAYIYAAVIGNWHGFPNQPAKYCLDYCTADLPFAAGWVAIATFTIALLLVGRVWWTSRA